MSEKAKYQLATDRLAYMIIYAPSFPSRRRQAFSEAFTELCQWLDELLAVERRETALNGISKCKDASLEAKRLFDAGDEDGGRFKIQYALRYLEFAAKGKPAPNPLF